MTTLEQTIHENKHRLTVHTIQIPIAHRLGLVNDPRYLDTTVKSGDKTFAPTWKMVMGHKEGGLSDQDYTDQYYAMMRESYRQNRQRWDEILAMNEVILACYCSAETFCHRYLLKDILVKLGAEYKGEITGDHSDNIS